jgi:hypothetical protein
MHVPQQAPPGFIDRTYVAQVDRLFQPRGTQMRRLPAVFERSHTRAAQFPGNLENQMVLGFVRLDSDHEVPQASVFSLVLSQNAFLEPQPPSMYVIES